MHEWFLDVNQVHLQCSLNLHHQRCWISFHFPKIFNLVSLIFIILLKEFTAALKIKEREDFSINFSTFLEHALFMYKVDVFPLTFTLNTSQRLVLGIQISLVPLLWVKGRVRFLLVHKGNWEKLLSGAFYLEPSS